MTDPEVTAWITDTEFTLTELEEFIARARAVDGIPQDALVAVTMPNAAITTKAGSGPIQFTLSASTAFRTKS